MNIEIEIKEQDVIVGKWYSFSRESDLPYEKYYDTGVEPKYRYMFAEYNDGFPIYYTEDELYCSIDTFKRGGDDRYWMAYEKLGKYEEDLHTGA